MKKRNKILYWIATIWLSLGMVSTGIVQLMKQHSGAGGVDSIVHLGYPVYLLAFLGILKFAGVIIILIPKFPVLKEWTYAGFFFLMTGAMYSHITMHDSAKEIFPAILLFVLTMASWYFRPADRKLIAVKNPSIQS